MEGETEMILDFVNYWESNKGILEDHFRKTKQEEYGDYKDLVRLLFDLVINPGIKSTNSMSCIFNIDTIVILDNGDYQGSEIFILHKDCYQPGVTDYIYTYVYYGSCSGCDTLQGIQSYSSLNDKPTEDQIMDYMTLCLHLLQSCVYMRDGDGINE